MGTLSGDDIRFAILSEDAKTIATAPGIGAKTAKKLILELKDKIDMQQSIETALDGRGAVEDRYDAAFFCSAGRCCQCIDGTRVFGNGCAKSSAGSSCGREHDGRRTA